jgi:hypothetical protein
MDKVSIIDILRSLINPVDIIVAAGVLTGLAIGMKKGFSEMFFNLAKNCIVLALSLSTLYPLADSMKERVLFSPVATLFTVFAVSAVVFYAGFTVLFYFLKKIVEVRWVDPVHSIFGGGLGMLNAAVFISMFILLFTFMPTPFFIRYIYPRSFSGYAVARTVIFVHNKALSNLPGIREFDGERFLAEIEARLAQAGDEPRKEKRPS